MGLSDRTIADVGGEVREKRLALGAFVSRHESGLYFLFCKTS